MKSVWWQKVNSYHKWTRESTPFVILKRNFEKILNDSVHLMSSFYLNLILFLACVCACTPMHMCLFRAKVPLSQPELGPSIPFLFLQVSEGAGGNLTLAVLGQRDTFLFWAEFGNFYSHNLRVLFPLKKDS